MREALQKEEDPENEDSGEVYDVEKILAKCIEDGVKLYRIKWMGFPVRDATWEAEGSLSCDAKLRIFESICSECQKCKEFWTATAAALRSHEKICQGSTEA